MKTKSLQEINGHEIIEFLNKETLENDALCDISIVPGSFIFQSQEVKYDTYILKFTGNFNNWGTEQPIHGNTLCIKKDTLWFNLEEPFEGDGTDNALKAVLNNWIESHVFDVNTEEMFYSVLKEAYDEIASISFASKNEMQSVIDKLILAKTLMK
jgi:hypothetical protein